MDQKNIKSIIQEDLDYEADEIYSTLLALLEYRGIFTYQSKFGNATPSHSLDSTFSQKLQFSKPFDSKGKNISRESTPLIFTHTSRIFVHIYSRTD